MTIITAILCTLVWLYVAYLVARVIGKVMK
jgi:hypothetical protein